jgi:mRNA-degrading endonuclease YafQ of YafQ-DinJ toxin-antitoxin module
MLANDEPLPEKHRDHALIGNWIGYRAGRAFVC